MHDPEVLARIERAANDSATTLNLSGMGLTDVPEAITRLTSLQELDLSNNPLTSVPEAIGGLTSLQALDLSNNQLTSVPEAITLLAGLRVINLRGNDLIAIPEEFLEESRSDAQTILRYYTDWLTKPKRRLSEAKVLLVGEGKVGKTSLVNRMIDNEFHSDEKQTDGILIRQWHAPFEGGDLRLNVWDFGGQEIQHSTHQFFLSRRSVYVLVLDSRAGEHQSRLDYWLRIIGNYGGDSPVIVVLNKADEHALKLDEHLYQSKFPSIAGFVRASCKTGQGIDELRSKIVEVAGGLRHVRMDWLQTWFDVRAALENSGRDYLRVERYEEICEDHGITYPSERQQLLRYLHDLGVQLHFEDVALIGTNILQPEWVTRGVYAIVTDRGVSAANGVLRKADLSRILDGRRYPHDTPMFIVNVMRQFELCVPMGTGSDEHWLIPDLLSPSQPGDLVWDEGDSLGFQYRYEVLPGSVMSRFIANTWPMVHKDIAWRNGIALSYQNGLNPALVKADPEAGVIAIWVTGNGATRRDFLNVIRGHFEHIHRSLKRDVAEYVPIPGHPGIAPELYSDLLAYEEAGEQTFFNPKLKQRLSVKELLDGVSGISREQKHELLRKLSGEFNKDELETLFYKLEGKTLENVSGDRPRENLVIEIIEYFEHRRRLHELIDAVNRERAR